MLLYEDLLWAAVILLATGAATAVGLAIAYRSRWLLLLTPLLAVIWGLVFNLARRLLSWLA